MKSGAIFSRDKKYRYVLWRIWDIDKPRIAFIGLNPSKANGVEDDPTIRRVIGFAKSWGYGGVYMLNVFAYISTKQSGLKETDDPVGVDNDFHLKGISKKVRTKAILAWGNNKMVTANRLKNILGIFPNAYVLGFNNNGSPKHPLFMPSKTYPIIYSPIIKFDPRY